MAIIDNDAAQTLVGNPHAEAAASATTRRSRPQLYAKRYWQSLSSCARQNSSRCSTPATTAPKYASGLAYRKATSRSRARTRSVSFLVSVASVSGRPPTLGPTRHPAGNAGVERPATSWTRVGFEPGMRSRRGEGEGPLHGRSLWPVFAEVDGIKVTSSATVRRP